MMARCDDRLFYKIICVSLLGIAVTFTVILTNVFVDIDNLIYSEEASTESEAVKIKVQGVLLGEATVNEVPVNEDSDNSSNTDNNETDIRDNTSRTRRSVADSESEAEADSYKDSKSISSLTNKIVKLLNDMDQDDHSSTIKYGEATYKTDTKNIHVKSKTKHEIKEISARNVKQEFENIKSLKIQQENDSKYDFLHLGMHNILLNGIINHADLSDVFKKVHYLIESYQNVNPQTEITTITDYQKQHTKKKEIKNELSLSGFKDDEEHIFNELINCARLKQDLAKAKKENERKALIKTNKKKYRPHAEARRLIIKTIIDVNDEDLDESTAYLNDTTERQHECGGESEVIINKGTKGLLVKLLKSINAKNHKPDETQKHEHQTAYLDELLDEYFNNFNENTENNNLLDKDTRPKREVDISEYVSKTRPKTQKNKDKDYQDLYVEIETHFKNHDLKSDTKKQIVNSFIKKIEKALHLKTYKNNATEEKVHTKKHTHVKKRIQHSYTKNENKSIHEVEGTHNTSRRILKPIIKSVSNKEPVAQYADGSGNIWSKKFTGPSLFTGSKSINSAEMHEVAVDFHQVAQSNGIPQRLQQPLQPIKSDEGDNSYKDGRDNLYKCVGDNLYKDVGDNSYKDVRDNSYKDLGNIRFIVNGLEGSGLSIGYNQFTDAPPDPSIINVFTGLNDLINTYQNNYTTVNEKSRESNEFSDQNYHTIDKRHAKHKDYFFNTEKNSKQVTQNQFISNIFTRSEENKEKGSIHDNVILTEKRKIPGKNNNHHIRKIINLSSKVKMQKFMKKSVKRRKKRQLEYLPTDGSYPNQASEQQGQYHLYDSEETGSDNETKQTHTDAEEQPLNSNEAVENKKNNYDQSHYPHMFMEDELDSNYMTKIPFKIKIHAKNHEQPEPDNSKNHIPELDDMFDRITPGRNFELSYKLLSNNDSASSGYKVHTTINKLYKKDGVNIFTLNVSHIAKLEKENDTELSFDYAMNNVHSLPLHNIIQMLKNESSATPQLVEVTQTTFPSEFQKTEQTTSTSKQPTDNLIISVVGDTLYENLLKPGYNNNKTQKLVKFTLPTSPVVDLYIAKEQFEKVSFDWLFDKLGIHKKNLVTTRYENTTSPFITTPQMDTETTEINQTTETIHQTITTAVQPTDKTKYVVQPNYITKYVVQTTDNRRAEVQPADITKYVEQPTDIRRAEVQPVHRTKYEVQPADKIKFVEQPIDIGRAEVQPAHTTQYVEQLTDIRRANSRTTDLRRAEVQPALTTKYIVQPADVTKYVEQPADITQANVQPTDIKKAVAQPMDLTQAVEEQLLFNSLLLNKVVVKLEKNTDVIGKLLNLLKREAEAKRTSHNTKPALKNMHHIMHATQLFNFNHNATFLPYIHCIHTHSRNHTHYVRQCHLVNNKMLTTTTLKPDIPDNNKVDVKPKSSDTTRADLTSLDTTLKTVT